MVTRSATVAPCGRKLASTRDRIRERVRASGAVNGSLCRRSASRTVSRSSGSLISSRSRSPLATFSISASVSLAVRRPTTRLTACLLARYPTCFQVGLGAGYSRCANTCTYRLPRSGKRLRRRRRHRRRERATPDGRVVAGEEVLVQHLAVLVDGPRPEHVAAVDAHAPRESGIGRLVRRWVDEVLLRGSAHDHSAPGRDAPHVDLEPGVAAPRVDEDGIRRVVAPLEVDARFEHRGVVADRITIDVVAVSVALDDLIALLRYGVEDRRRYLAEAAPDHILVGPVVDDRPGVRVSALDGDRTEQLPERKRLPGHDHDAVELRRAGRDVRVPRPARRVVRRERRSQRELRRELFGLLGRERRGVDRSRGLDHTSGPGRGPEELVEEKRAQLRLVDPHPALGRDDGDRAFRAHLVLRTLARMIENVAERCDPRRDALIRKRDRVAIAG